MKSCCIVSLLFGYGAAQRWNRALGASCEQGIDVVFLQDTTTTFSDDLPIVTGQIPDLIEQIGELFVGSKFAVAEFKDKPFYPLGFPGHDYCYRLLRGLSYDVTDVTRDYAELYASAGGDLPEAQYQALINVAYDSRVGWREFSDQPVIDINKTAARMVVLITDAQPHMAGDMAAYATQVPQLPANPGTIWQDRFDDFCSTYDYPTFQQVKEAIDEQQLAVIFLIKNHPADPLVKAAWQWFNDQLLGQPHWFVHEIKDDSINFSNVLVDIMHDVSTYACLTTPEPTTTTEETTTTEKTTTTEETTTTEKTTTTEETTTTEKTTTTTETTTTPTTTEPVYTTSPATIITPEPVYTTISENTSSEQSSSTETTTSPDTITAAPVYTKLPDTAWTEETLKPVGTDGGLLTRPGRTTTPSDTAPLSTPTERSTEELPTVVPSPIPTKSEPECPEATENPCAPPCGPHIANQYVINVPEGAPQLKLILEQA